MSEISFFDQLYKLFSGEPAESTPTAFKHDSRTVPSNLGDGEDFVKIVVPLSPLELARAIIDRKDAELIDEETLETELMRRTSIGDREAVVILLKNGACPYRLDDYGKSAISRLKDDKVMAGIYRAHGVNLSRG